jgi:hypothetical protein
MPGAAEQYRRVTIRTWPPGKEAVEKDGGCSIDEDNLNGRVGQSFRSTEAAKSPPMITTTGKPFSFEEETVVMVFDRL